MTFYRINRGSVAQSTTLDYVRIDVPAGRRLILHGLKSTGMASAIASGCSTGVYQSSGGTGGTAVTIEPLDETSTVLSGLAAAFGGTEATISAEQRAQTDWQPAGGVDVWPPAPGIVAEFWLATAYQVSVRGILGTSNVAHEIVFEVK